MQGYHLDPEGGVAEERYAVIYARGASVAVSPRNAWR